MVVLMKTIVILQGFIANTNNGSCRTPVVLGCIDNGSVTLDELISISGENGKIILMMIITLI